MWQISDSDHPNLRSGGPSSLFLIAWSQVTTTPSTYLYWGHSALIISAESLLTLCKSTSCKQSCKVSSLIPSQHKAGYDNSYRYRWNNWLVQTWLDAWGIFYPGGEGVLNKFLYWEGPPQGPTPYPFIYHFSRKKYPFRIPSIVYILSYTLFRTLHPFQLL